MSRYSDKWAQLRQGYAARLKSPSGLATLLSDAVSVQAEYEATKQFLQWVRRTRALFDTMPLPAHKRGLERFRFLPAMKPLPQITPGWMHDAEEQFRAMEVNGHTLVWRVAGHPTDFTVKPNRPKGTGYVTWDGLPVPWTDPLSPSVQPYVNFNEFANKHDFDWNCGTLLHQFHLWWDSWIGASNTLFLLLAKPDGIITMRHQACVTPDAQVLARFTH